MATHGDDRTGFKQSFSGNTLQNEELRSHRDAESFLQDRGRRLHADSHPDATKGRRVNDTTAVNTDVRAQDGATDRFRGKARQPRVNGANQDTESDISSHMRCARCSRSARESHMYACLRWHVLCHRCVAQPVKDMGDTISPSRMKCPQCTVLQNTLGVTLRNAHNGPYCSSDILHRSRAEEKASRVRDRTQGQGNPEPSGGLEARYLTHHPTCGICFEQFRNICSPIAATLAGNSSTGLSYGLRLPCPKTHGYCLDCITKHIHSKLDPEGRGVDDTNGTVFPIPCPECPPADWRQGIQDDTARRILDEQSMVLWHHRKLIDSMPRLYCANPKCSILVQPPDDPNEPLAECPICHHMMCVPCRVEWHQNMTCAQFQALPLDERSPEDRQLLEMAKANNWRRCPNCSIVVERTEGCNHMTCKCGAHFCIRCGSFANPLGRCLRNPPCQLFDDDIVDEQERIRPRALAVPRRPRAPGPHLRGDVAPRNFAHLQNFQRYEGIPQPEVDYRVQVTDAEISINMDINF